MNVRICIWNFQCRSNPIIREAQILLFHWTDFHLLQGSNWSLTYECQFVSHISITRMFWCCLSFSLYGSCIKKDPFTKCSWEGKIQRSNMCFLYELYFLFAKCQNCTQQLYKMQNANSLSLTVLQPKSSFQHSRHYSDAKLDHSQKTWLQNKAKTKCNPNTQF